MLEVIEVGVDVIMFDNCFSEVIKGWILLVFVYIVIEVSGGIMFGMFYFFRDSGVDYILFGVLMYLVGFIDISLDLLIERGIENDEFIINVLVVNVFC